MVELPTPAGFVDNRAMDVSDNGIICGFAQDSSGTARAWRWINGVYQFLPATASGCQPSRANGVNNDGTVVGTGLLNASACPTQYGFYFSDATGSIPLGVLSAEDVNKSGMATGEGFGAAYRYSPATGIQLIGMLTNDDTAEGRAINDDNNVTGRSISHVTGPDHWRAFFFSTALGMIQISTGQSRSSGEALNIHDHAVGSDGTTSSPSQYPWIWSAASGRVDLTSLVNAPGFVLVNSPVGINDHDLIIAKAHSSNGADNYGYGVLLLPVGFQSFCAGDGSGAPCPCGNAGAAGNGCANSLNPNGANLAATGQPSVAADSLRLVGSGMPDGSALYFQGTTQVAGGLGSAFGDGLRCVGGSVRRLGTELNVGGNSQHPASGDPPVSIQGAVAPGDVRAYQVWYRNPAVFCTSSTFNLTNAVQVVWTP